MFVSTAQLDGLVTVIVTQPNHFHVSQADAKLQRWKEELLSMTEVNANSSHHQTTACRIDCTISTEGADDFDHSRLGIRRSQLDHFAHSAKVKSKLRHFLLNRTPLSRLTKYEDAEWFLFVTEDTEINFMTLNESLANFDPTTQALFLGHALSDDRPVITHHFAPRGFISYPHLPSGFLLSRPALLR